MKKMVIRNVQVVGMHHYGRRELAIMGTYHVELEPCNPYDPIAVAVFDGSRKVGNLKRDCARAVGEILKQKKAKSKYLLKPLEETNVKSRRTGPQQTCAIAFKLDEMDITSLTDIAVKSSCIYVKVMDLPKKSSINNVLILVYLN